MSFSVYKDGERVEGKLLMQKISRHDIGVFESMRTYKRKIFREDEHLCRLLESAKTTGFPLSLKKNNLKKLLKQTLVRYYKDSGSDDDVFLRVTVMKTGTYIFIGARTHPPEIYEKGISLKTTVTRRSSSNAGAPESKTLSYQNAVLGGLGPREEKPYEWLFLGADGYVAEVSIGNIFIVRHAAPGSAASAELVTPPLPGILNGVTRRFVIKCALLVGLDVKEEPFTRHQIYAAREAFLTNTSWEILPVRDLDSRIIGRKTPGEITLKLRKKFKEKVQAECRS